MKNRIRSLIQLLAYFLKTEIVGGVELAVWFAFRDFFISLTTIKNDVFGIKYIVPFVLIIIPLLTAISEYQSKKTEINKALNCLFN